MPYIYCDIGLNLFTKSFPHPEKIIEDILPGLTGPAARDIPCALPCSP